MPSFEDEDMSTVFNIWLDSDKSIGMYLDFGIEEFKTRNGSELIVFKNFEKSIGLIASKIQTNLQNDK
ncbi:hypothetical protein GCM10023314_15310 [Algibacter agarivorans]|uniref:Uncharacterized protein n=1 Tax=Algibacter agarivorans TaxID=1109741 RepID=A0ABP9GGV5_9FLAO